MTYGWLVFVTVALNCTCCEGEASNVIVCGLTETAMGGSSVIVATAVAVFSAWLIAVSVTVCGAVMFAGAVYKPVVLIVPTPVGVIIHVTATMQLPVTEATNC